MPTKLGIIQLYLAPPSLISNPFSEEEVYQAGTAVVTALTAIAAWWKNNSFSKEALTADEYMKALKKEEK